MFEQLARLYVERKGKEFKSGTKQLQKLTGHMERFARPSFDYRHQPTITKRQISAFSRLLRIGQRWPMKDP